MKERFRNLISQKAALLKGDSLKARCFRGSLFLGSGTVVAKGLAFASKVILAKLLVPEEIGLMVLIIGLTAFFDTLTEVGIKQSVIQNKNGSKSEYLNAAWWFQAVRGAGLYAIAFLIAPTICRFYFADKPEVLESHAWPELFLMVRVAFLAIVFRGFISPRAFVLEKEFRFGKAVFLLQGSGILGTVITIVLAFVLKSVWAMVIGYTSIALFNCLFSYLLCPFGPTVSFDGESFRSLLRFAKGLLGSPILAYLAFYVDILVAGKLLNSDLLGMYGMAKVLALFPREMFSKVVGPVLLPAFSEKQDDPWALSRALVKLTGMTVLVALPFAVVAGICSKDILTIVFQKSYASVSTAFTLLCFNSVIMMVSVILVVSFFAIGQPEKHRMCTFIRALIISVLIYPVVKAYGVNGAAAVLIFGNTGAFVVALLVLSRTIGLRVSEYTGSVIPAVLASVPVVIVLWLCNHLWADLRIMRLILGVAAGLIAVTIALLMKQRVMFCHVEA